MQEEEFDFDRDRLSQKLLSEYLEEEDALSDDARERIKWLRIRQLLLSVVALLLVGFFIFAWQTDKFALTTSEVDSLPLIRAEKTPVKVQPDDPGGIKVANMDKSVYSSINEDEEKELPSVTRILPAPEAPVKRAEIALRPLKTEEIESSKEEAGVVAAKSTVKPPKVETSQKDAPTLIEKEVTLEDVIGEALKDITPEDVMPAPVPKRKKIVMPSQQSDDDSGVRIQLGAFRTYSEANDNWNKVKKKFANELKNKKHYIIKADLGAKGVFYRLQVGSLENTSEGRAVCNDLIQQKQGCFIVK